MLKSAAFRQRSFQAALLFALVILTAVWSYAGRNVSSPPADTIIINARVYTAARGPSTWAEAIALKGDKIVSVGTATQINHFRGPHTMVIDGGGRLVVPGFTDCHIHFLDGALSLEQIQLEGTKDVAEIQQRVKAYAGAHPDKPWILGRGWSYPVFGKFGLPDKRMLDEIVPDRPVYLEGFDGHTWWANSKALQMAGITKQTPDPPGGSIVHDPKTGDPTGAIKEDSADALMRRVIPPPSQEEKLKALRAGLKEANRVGLVRVHSAGGVSVNSSDLSNVDLLEQLRQSGELTLRFYLAYRVNPPIVTRKQVQEIEQVRRRYHDDWISAGAVKFFMDGVIETHTAAMLQPYSDDPSLSGELLWEPEKYQQAVTELDRMGIQVFTHAIGDRAIRTALDGYESAAKTNRSHDARHRIEHIEAVSAVDIPRFGKLGVIASMQPLHAYPDDDTLKLWAGNVGPERAQRAWAWNSIQKQGGHLAFGSDWPVVTMNPWRGLQNAVTRQTPEGDPPGGFVPQERISLQDAIEGYTIGAAYAGHRERTEGSLEPGKLADLIVLNQDLFKIEPNEIGKTEVLLTVVGGKVVYQSPNWDMAKSSTAGTQ